MRNIQRDNKMTKTFTSQSKWAKDIDKSDAVWYVDRVVEGEVGGGRPEASQCTGGDIQQHTVRLEITG